MWKQGGGNLDPTSPTPLESMGTQHLLVEFYVQFLVTIPRAGLPSLMKFHLIDNLVTSSMK